MEKRKSNRVHGRQFKSLDPKNEVELNADYYGEDDNISTPIVTNYNYKPERQEQ